MKCAKGLTPDGRLSNVAHVNTAVEATRTGRMIAGGVDTAQRAAIPQAYVDMDARSNVTLVIDLDTNPSFVPTLKDRDSARKGCR